MCSIREGHRHGEGGEGSATINIGQGEHEWASVQTREGGCDRERSWSIECVIHCTYLRIPHAANIRAEKLLRGREDRARPDRCKGCIREPEAYGIVRNVVEGSREFRMCLKARRN